ncbi:FabD/lysophospholipase-like protein [Xylaria scruposa]|nr:FabD/lysophospholipase-like protein [Xylaria scruposa]
MDTLAVILSLDGGGIRGISSIFILENLMEEIRNQMPSHNQKSTPKPSQVFDLIGGTSTGGIIATMLGRLNMTTGDCIKAYRDVAKRAFVPREKTGLKCILQKIPVLNKIPDPEGAFSAENLEQAIQFVVKKYCNEENCSSSSDVGEAASCPHASTKMFRDRNCCNTAVLAITKVDVDVTPTVFGTYKTTAEFEDCTIAQVVRATSAATTFFPSIKLGRLGMEFIDAGLGYNNPCEILESEARELFGPEKKIYIISIGTGTSGALKINGRRAIVKALADLATSARRVDQNMKGRLDQHQYFRFNVNKGLEDTTLSDWEETSSIAALTHNYLQDNSVKDRIRECAKKLVEVVRARDLNRRE